MAAKKKSTAKDIMVKGMKARPLTKRQLYSLHYALTYVVSLARLHVSTSSSYRGSYGKERIKIVEEQLMKPLQAALKLED